MYSGVRPALPAVADHFAERDAQRGGDQQDRQNLQEVREGRGILQRMGGVHAEEPAAVGAELLDRDLRRRGTDGDRLRRHGTSVGVDRRFEQRRFARGVERLHHTLRHEGSRENERERKQDVERSPHEVDPEVADRVGSGAGEAADERDEDRHARCGRDEVLNCEGEHLREGAHRRFAAVSLPVRVRDEADRRVERRVGRDGGERRGIQRQDALQPLDRIDGSDADDARRKDGGPVLPPRHLARAVDAAESIDESLDRRERPLEQRRASCVDARHVKTKRLCARKQHGEKNRELEKCVRRHQNFSGLRRANAR